MGLARAAVPTRAVPTRPGAPTRAATSGGHTARTAVRVPVCFRILLPAAG
jgi:hypothetical protein